MRAPWILVLFSLLIAACGPRATLVPVEPKTTAVPFAKDTPAAPVAKASGPVVLDGTPEIPDALKRRLEKYQNTRSAGLSDLATDGKSMLITTRFGRTSQVHMVRAPMGMRKQLTFASEPVRSATLVPDGGGAFVYLADRGGNEQYQIFRSDPTTGRKTALTGADARILSFAFDRAGKRLAYASNARNKRDFDIWVGDGSSQEKAKLLAKGKGYWYPEAWSRDGKWLLVGEYISINDSRYHLVEVDTGKLETITRPPVKDQPTISYGSALFSADGKRLYVTSDREGEFTELYEFDLAKKSYRPLTHDIPWNVDEVALSPNSRTLAFTTNEGGVSRLYLMDTRSRKKVAAKVPDGLLGGLMFARNAEVLGFTRSSAVSTGDAYTYDTRRRKLVRWTESEIGGLNSKSLAEPKFIDFEGFDGKKIPAFYYRPAGQEPFAVVIQIHGGPESQARPRFSPLTQFLVSEEKIAVIYPNVRGSSGYGKSYVKLDNGKKREDSVKDIGALLDWIAKQPELDKNRVAVYGGSYGGYMVLASMVHFGDRIRAAVDIVGISSFVTFLENTADYRRNVRRVEYGDESDPDMRAFLTKISPLTHVDKIQGALFVAQGANDPRVPASEADQIVKAVRAAGHDVWYMLAKNEGHGFRKKENRDTFLQLSVMFLRQQLKP